MSTSYRSLLGLSSISKGWRALFWLVGGPAASLFATYIAFLILAFGLGAGFDIDDKGTRFQKFWGSITLPVCGLILACGVLYSLFKAVSCWTEVEGKEEPNQRPEGTPGKSPSSNPSQVPGAPHP
jgi:hypothetical protein